MYIVLSKLSARDKRTLSTIIQLFLDSKKVCLFNCNNEYHIVCVLMSKYVSCLMCVCSVLFVCFLFNFVICCVVDVVVFVCVAYLSLCPKT